MAAADPTQRFSTRVADYVRARPDYPRGMIEWLHATIGLAPTWTVADIGAGTGISTKLFLEAGNAVIAVEPNAPMRAAADAWCGSFSKFRSVAGRAEETGLASASVDLVAVAQAFHWFDEGAVRREWARILRPSGFAAVYWNTRRLTGSAFLEGYENLLRTFCPEYSAIADRHQDEGEMRAWFGSGFVAMKRLDHRQALDFEGLCGRLLSSSYVPQLGDPRHAPIIAALRQLFDRTAQGGVVRFDYDTEIYVGRVVNR